MSGDALLAVHGDRVAAEIRRDGDRLRLIYDDAWRSSGAFPVSLSMPLASAVHEHDVVEAFLWNLLPDNERVLERWGRRFQVSARNPFRLLAHVGEECAGAFGFLRPERVGALDPGGGVVHLRTRDIAARLHALRDDHSAWRLPTDTGQFSLAGAQPKIALLRRRGRWAIPSGSTPTTHILKPPLAELDGHVQNEHLCLSLARALGLPAASSQAMRFGDELAIVVERYDRADLGARGVVRLHQEDLCQALALRPARKYQSDGGPTPRDIASLLRVHSSRPSEDVATFRDALVFNWLIAGTDAHAKNYSILHGRGGRVRLAPLYDLATALPYFGADARRLKLAMKIGRHYRIDDIRRGDWETLSDALAIDPRETRDRILELADGIPATVSSLADELVEQGFGHPILAPLREALSDRARTCAALLG